MLLLLESDLTLLGHGLVNKNLLRQLNLVRLQVLNDRFGVNDSLVNAKCVVAAKHVCE